MVIAEALISFLWLILAVLTLGAVLIVRRGVNRGGSGPDEDSDSARTEAERRETNFAGRVANLEMRLHDFARGVEARLETRSLQLDQLVAEADREIIRLTELLKAASRCTGAPSPDMVRGVGAPEAAARSDSPSATPDESPFALSAATEHVVLHLHDAGYSLPEIAQIVGRSVEQIRSLLPAA